MGGSGSRTTTELVEGGEQYNLQQDTSGACGITEPGSDYIILTGAFGYYTSNTVAKYTLQGFFSDLPSLKIGRYGHGCGVFVTKTGNKVYVVAGGEDNNYNALSSTEVLYDGGL